MTPAWVAAFSSLSLLVVVIGLAVLGLLRRFDSLLGSSPANPAADLGFGHTPGGLDPGAIVPEFVAFDLDGLAVDVKNIQREEGILLLLRAGCGPCSALIRAIVAAENDELRRRVIAVVSTVEEIDALYLRESGLRMVIQDGNSVFAALETTATPFAFAIGETGHITGKLIPSSAEDLMRLLHAERSGVIAREKVPA